jgi:hypothetical protein
VGYKFSLILSRVITDEESAILQDAGCACAIFTTDTLPTNADVTVTKMDFDDTVTPTLAEAIESALEAVKKVPELTVPGLTVPAQPAEAPTAESPAVIEGVVVEDVVAAAAEGVVVEDVVAAAAEGVVVEGVVADEKPTAKKTSTRRTAAKKERAAKNPTEVAAGAS